MNLNEFKEYKNGIRFLTQDQKFYYEKLYVVNQCLYELILLSEEYTNDIIKAVESESDFSFIYASKKYKIVERTRFLESGEIELDMGFDFQNTVETVVGNFVEVREILSDECPNEMLVVDLGALCEENVVIKDDCVRVNIDEIDGKWKNVFVKGKDVVLSYDMSDINIVGNNVFVNRGCKGLDVEGNDIVVGAFCESVNIGKDSEYIVVGDRCKNIEIKNVCERIDIKEECENVFIGNQSQNIEIESMCGINGLVYIGDNVNGRLEIGNNCANFGEIIIGNDCGKNGQILIGDNCGSNFGEVVVCQRCAINGSLVVEDNCGYDSGEIMIEPSCSSIKIHKYSGSGNRGKVFVSPSCEFVDVDIGENESLEIGVNVKKCILKKTDDFDAAVFMYFIKENVDTYINEIKEYKTVGSVTDDDYIDMFDEFAPNENFRIRL